MCQTVLVPPLVIPTGFPDEIAAATDVLGNVLRTEILHRLGQAPQSASELAQAIDTAQSSVHRHLAVLEQHELVEADLPLGERAGPVGAQWTINTDRVRALAEAWARYASGG